MSKSAYNSITVFENFEKEFFNVTQFTIGNYGNQNVEFLLNNVKRILKAGSDFNPTQFSVDSRHPFDVNIVINGNSNVVIDYLTLLNQ